MATTAKTPAAGKAPASETTTVTLQRGTFEDIVDGLPKSYGPGDTVDVCAEDLAMLKRLGFVSDAAAAQPEVVQDGTLVSLQTAPGDGPTITPVG